MNIVIKQKRYQGSVLLMALMIAWVIGIALVSYLTLVANQNRTTYRAQAWNSCIPVLEAGVEEALAQIHYAQKTGNFGANQWSYNATDGRYHKSRALTNSAGSYFEVSIQPTDPRGEPHGPIIFSTGFTPAPAATGTPMGGETAFGMILATVTPLSASPRFVNRTVCVTTRRIRWGVINSQGPVNLSGGPYLDSFDSSNPNYNDGTGAYDKSKRKAGALVLTNSKDPNAIVVNGTIYGSVNTGPGGNVVASSGSVGDLSWAGTQSGVQAGRQTDDANIQFDDVAPPFPYGSALTPTDGIAVLNGVSSTYTFLLESGNYNMGSVSLSGGRTMFVAGDATLYVNGNFSISGSSSIIIAPGASLKLYIAGSANFSGNGIVNWSGRARNLSIYGLNTSTSFSYSGTSAFVGTVYAPHAALKFTGSTELVGSFTGQTVNVNGGAHIAYDEDIKGDFIMDSWNEI